MTQLLSTRYAGLTLKNPIIIGSSGLTNTVEKIKELEKAGAGAVVLKSLFEEQISRQSDWMMASSDYPEAKDYIRNYVQNHEVDEYLNLIQESQRQCNIPIIASINCYEPGTWIDFAHQVEMAGASAIELNLFVMQTAIGANNNPEIEQYIRIVQQIKAKVNIPVIVKMGKYFDNIPAFVNQLYANGVAGVVLFNRFYQPDIDINKLQMVSGQVFSSHSDFSDTLRWTGIVAGKIPNLSIASCTGLQDWEDVVKCLLAGARAVELCSTIYQHGSEIISQILRSMEEWMHTMNFRSIEECSGKLSYRNIPDPMLYERIQFMKYFSNRD